MVSDYGGWKGVQRDVVVEMCERRPELEAAGLVSVAWMSYLDDPNQTGGYFQIAEAHKGLKYADNTPKPAWHVWKECVTKRRFVARERLEPAGRDPAEEKRIGLLVSRGAGARGRRVGHAVWRLGGRGQAQTGAAAFAPATRRSLAYRTPP
jgi:hypothetical protein